MHDGVSVVLEGKLILLHSTCRSMSYEAKATDTQKFPYLFDLLLDLSPSTVDLPPPQQRAFTLTVGSLLGQKCAIDHMP